MDTPTLDALARDALLEHYGCTASVRPLAGEYDANFLVTAANGERSIFKIAHPQCDASLSAMQCAALRHVARHDPQLPLPRVLPCITGADVCTVTVAGRVRQAWHVSFLPGVLWCDAYNADDELHTDLGNMVGRLDRALESFDHPAATRSLEWQLTLAGEKLADCAHLDSQIRALAQRAVQQFTAEIEPQLARVPWSVIHNDVNNHNVLVARTDQRSVVSGLVDFGDMGHQPTVCELAIACTYAAFGQTDPVQALARVVAGYHAQRALSDAELAVLPGLIQARLAVSLAIAERRRRAGAANDAALAYATISEDDASELLQHLAQLPPRLLHMTLAQACARAPVPASERVMHTLQVTALTPPVARQDEQPLVLDLSAGSLLLGADPAHAARVELTRRIDAAMAAAGASVAIGRYAEPRLLYNDPAFAGAGDGLAERRTVHLGIDIFCAANTRVRAPLAGTVHRVANNARHLDYGPLVILRHKAIGGGEFFTLYGHLDMASVRELTVGQPLVAGESFARVGSPPHNGDWPPHLHLQLILDDLELGTEFPGVCAPSAQALWRALSPNPAVLLGIDPARVDGAPNVESLRARRERVLSGALSLSYARPLHIVRGFGAYLYDSHARTYLDVYNNVAHVGHCHPHVTEAISRQLALLNTNTRYLHDVILTYAERLCGYFPGALDVCFFVNSASEGNELALRLARAATGRRDMVVAAGAYHGHTSSLIEMSPYKYAGPGGNGAADWVHEVPVADDYRGPFKRSDPQAGKRYAAMVADTLAALPPGHAAAGFIAETLPSVGGQLVLPPGYLAAVYAHVRAHGGVCIADEVQTGFGRLGEWFWGFEGQQVVPDIVVLGKPIGNGFPLAAVITTSAIARAFDNGMEFFATFGGNPVACAAGLAVLDVLEREELPARAQRLGEQLMAGLEDLQERHALIGDVRGKGFFAGVELVTDRTTLAPAASQTAFVVNRLRERHVLAGTDGPLHNVIKIRPTMVTSAGDIALLVDRLDEALTDAQRFFGLPRHAASL